MSDIKYTVKKESEARIKIKHSEFIARIARINTISDAKEFISKVAKSEKNANHNCWAYILDKNIYHYSDAGEPSGTAGKPIYNTLCKNNLSKVVAVVTRYFGGVKLGIRGLIDAYSQSIELAIKSADLEPLIKFVFFQIKTDYSFAEIFKHKVSGIGAEIVKITYTDKVLIQCKIQERFLKEFENYLYEMRMQKKIELLEKK